MLGLLARYSAGIRYALELQVLHRGTSETCQAEDDDTNQSVSSIEEDFVTAFEHLEEDDTGDYVGRLLDRLNKMINVVLLLFIFANSMHLC